MQLELTVDRLADAVCWKEKNPRAYKWMVECARDDVAKGFRPSVALYVEVLRRPHWAARLGLRRSDAQFLIRNALRADIARLIMREHPDLTGTFLTRKAGNDSW
jgi:hypothetical protein